MVTKQIIQEKLDNLTEEQLNQVYHVIEKLSSSENLSAWDQAINQINNSDQNQEKLKQLCQSWAELDDDNEQKETLKIIESLEGVSI